MSSVDRNRVRDGRLLAAAQNVDLDAGHVDNATREYWYRQADVAYLNQDRFNDEVSECDWPGCGARFQGNYHNIEVVNHVSRVHLHGGVS